MFMTDFKKNTWWEKTSKTLNNNIDIISLNIGTLKVENLKVLPEMFAWSIYSLKGFLSPYPHQFVFMLWGAEVRRYSADTAVLFVRISFTF